jgi:hypothetical protein
VSIRDDLNKAKQYERAFNLVRWGEGIPENIGTRGWPKNVNETDSGRFGVNLATDFEIQSARIFTFDNDDGSTTTKLAYTLKVADQGHGAANDTGDFQLYLPSVEELKDEDLPFPKTKTRDTIVKLLELMHKFKIVDDDPLGGEWEQAVNILLLNFEKLQGRFVKAGVNGVMYAPKDDPTTLKGPYMDVRWFNPETDGSYAAATDDEMPF